MQETAIERMRGLRVAMDATFMEIFRETPNQWYYSGSIAEVIGESNTDTGGHKNWSWKSLMEDLATKGKLIKENEMCKQTYDEDGNAKPLKVRRSWYKFNPAPN